MRSVAIPPGGVAEDARDLAADASGNILVYNGTFDPYLSTYDRQHLEPHHLLRLEHRQQRQLRRHRPLWQLRLRHGHEYRRQRPTRPRASFASTAPTARPRASPPTIDFIDLTVGGDNKLYALTAARKIYVYDPNTLAQSANHHATHQDQQRHAGLPRHRRQRLGADFRCHLGQDGPPLQQQRHRAGQRHPDQHRHRRTHRHRRLRRRQARGRLALRPRHPDDRGLHRHHHFSAGSNPVFVAFALPTLSISDASVTEGNSGTVDATFTVTLSATSGQTCHRQLRDRQRHCQAGSDFTGVSGTLTFAPGETSKTITVSVLADTIDELTKPSW